MKKFLKSIRFWQVISAILFIAVLGSGGDSNTQELTDLKTNLESVQAGNTELNDLYDKSIDDIANLNAEIEDLQSQLASKEDEIATLNQASESSKDYETKISDLESQIDSLTKDNSALQSKVAEYEKTISDLTTASSSASSKDTVTGDSDSDSSSSSSASIDPSNGSGSSGGTIVYITNTGEKYHRGSCSYLKNSKIEIDKNDAIARGYTACSRCKP